MSNLDASLRRFDSLTRRWKPTDERSFEDYAALLTLAKVIKQQTAEEALKLSGGFSRELLIRLHGMAVDTETNVRSRLAAWGHHPAPGDAA